VKGTRGDKEVSNTLNTPGKVELLKATVYKDELIEAQSGFKQIEISLTDATGELMYDAENEVSVKVTGDAALLGLENGNSNDVSSYGSGKTKALKGKLIAYVLGGDNHGAFDIEVSSPGLQPELLHFVNGILK
ncbi:MAG: beta-galactosidase, partial [Ferruginibacter sp.]